MQTKTTNRRRRYGLRPVSVINNSLVQADSAVRLPHRLLLLLALDVSNSSKGLDHLWLNQHAVFLSDFKRYLNLQRLRSLPRPNSSKQLASRSLVSAPESPISQPRITLLKPPRKLSLIQQTTATPLLLASPICARP